MTTGIILGFQVRAERQRYTAAANYTEQLAKSLPGSPEIVISKDCSYTDNGAIFATKFLGCATNADINYQDEPSSYFEQVDKTIKTALKKDGISFHANQEGMGQNDLSNYVFDIQKLECGFSTTYYDENVPSSQRNKGAAPLHTDLYISIGCSGPAKAEYFPVVKY